MRALETRYNGYRFRSRLEARWAVFMDAMGVRYEYEKEAYDLDGLFYLPDFWLPQMKAHLEVKPEWPTKDEIEKANRLADHTDTPVFIIFGQPEAPWPSNDPRHESAISFKSGLPGFDCSHWWCECPHCRKCELQFNGRADRINCECRKSEHGDKGYNYDSERLQAAYEKARGYRFEPGAYNGRIPFA